MDQILESPQSSSPLVRERKSIRKSHHENRAQHTMRPSMMINDIVNHDPSTLGEAPEIILENFTVKIWETDEDLVAMRSHMNDKIRSTFGNGMKFFVDGDWEEAKREFKVTLVLTNGRDGPSKNILRHMEEDYGGVCPADWKGYRDMS